MVRSSGGSAQLSDRLLQLAGEVTTVQAENAGTENSQPTYLSEDELVATVKPTNAELAICCLYSNRYYTQKRLARAAKKLGHGDNFSLVIFDQFVDRHVGVRMVTFVTPIKHLAGGGQVAGAVFTFRGTRLNKAGTVRADFQLIRNRNAELLITQRALKHVGKHMDRLQLLHADVQWAFFTTGHSLGGFTAISTAILCPQVHSCVAFESPGLTTFYHELAKDRGDEAYWQTRIVNYLAIPNPINMCQLHLGRIFRVHFPRIECAIDMLHIFKCLLGTCVRVLNWCLLITLSFSMLRLLLGVTLSAFACSSLLAPGSGRLSLLMAYDCALGATLQPAALTSAVWTLKSAATFVAARLGTTVRHILQQHSMWHMAQAFDPATGLPFKSVEMISWPKGTRLSESFLVLLLRALRECFWALDSSEGISILLDRNVLIEARIAKLPGYVEVQDEDDASDASWLRRLGDVFELWSDNEDEPMACAVSEAPSRQCSAAIPIGTSPVASVRHSTEFSMPVPGESSPDANMLSDASCTESHFTTDAAGDSDADMALQANLMQPHFHQGRRRPSDEDEHSEAYVGQSSNNNWLPGDVAGSRTWPCAAVDQIREPSSHDQQQASPLSDQRVEESLAAQSSTCMHPVVFEKLRHRHPQPGLPWQRRM